MQTVFLQQKFTTLADVQQTYDALKHTVADDEIPSVQIIARTKIVKFDILFIAYFILFKLQFPQTVIRITLPFNNEKTDSDFKFILFQYGTYAYLMTGKSVFELSFGGKYIDFSFTGEITFPTNWFVLSKEFMLLSLIDRNDQLLYKILFQQPLSDLVDEGLDSLPQGCSWDKNPQSLLTNLTKIINAAVHVDERHQAIIKLGQLSFYRSLRRMKILSFYFIQDVTADISLRKEMKAERLSGDEAFSYYQAIRSLINEIAGYPLIGQFIFSTVLSSDRFPNVLHTGNKDSFAEILRSTWKFTKELVYGINELVKNVREHTLTGQGVVTGRIYQKEQAKGFRETAFGQSKVFDAYLKNLGNKNEHIKDLLEICVADLGTEGVIKTLLRNSEELVSRSSTGPEISHLVKLDIEQINKGNFRFQNLLNPQSGDRLYQQTKRSVAHWGFNIITKLIRKNSGLLVASTNGTDKNSERDTVAIVPSKAGNIRSDIRDGTLFQMIFPVEPKSDFVPHFAQTLELPSETTETDIKGLQQLFEMHILDWRSKSTSVVQQRKTNFFNMEIRPNRMLNREDEEQLWMNVRQMVSKVVTENALSTIIFHLNFDLITVDSSQLLRFLGSWEDTFKRVPLMLSGIGSPTYEAFIRLNHNFFTEYPEMSFWNTDTGIVFYTYTEIREDRFYFADVLWGNSLDDYLVINKLVARTNFNFTGLCWPEQKPLMTKISSYPNHPAFYNRHVLLPFDIIIQSSRGLTLFEHNSKVLLENNIKAI